MTDEAFEVAEVDMAWKCSVPLTPVWVLAVASPSPPITAAAAAAVTAEARILRITGSPSVAIAAGGGVPRVRRPGQRLSTPTSLRGTGVLAHRQRCVFGPAVNDYGAVHHAAPIGLLYRHGVPQTRTLSYVAGSLPIVGRSAERALLSAAYARAAAGGPQVVLITGAAGIGKTRLAEELCQEASRAGAQIRAGESAPLDGAALAYGPFVAALGEQAAWLLDDDGPGGMLAARHRLFLRVLALLGELAARAPLVLRLEDLHWADESSRELLAFLAVRLREVPVLLVATVREEDLDSGPRRWLAEIERCPRVSRLRLAGLPD